MSVSEVTETVRWRIPNILNGSRRSWQGLTTVPACTHTEALQTVEDSDSTKEDDNIQWTMTTPTTSAAAECSSRSRGRLLWSVVCEMQTLTVLKTSVFVTLPFQLMSIAPLFKRVNYPVISLVLIAIIAYITAIQYTKFFRASKITAHHTIWVFHTLRPSLSSSAITVAC